MSYMVIDVESVPLRIDDESVWIYLSEKATVRTMHPVFSKVIVIGMKKLDAEPEAIYSDNEKELLEKFWKLLSEQQPNPIVTYNGYGYDIPFLLVRSVINKVTPTMDIKTNKWYMEGSNHFDCMLVLSAKGLFLNVAQGIVCRMLGIDVPTGIISGAQIEEYYKRNEWEPIVNRCKQDVVMTEKLYGMLK